MNSHFPSSECFNGVSANSSHGSNNESSGHFILDLNDWIAHLDLKLEMLHKEMAFCLEFNRRKKT